MARRMAVIGGPADGLALTVRPSVFTWIDPEGNRTATPRAGAEMYRRQGWSYVHVHNQWRHCECGAVYFRRAHACPLCGTPAAPSV